MIKHNVDLDNPEAVKLFIALREEWSNGHKQIAVYAYDNYTQIRNIEWKPPFYKHKKSIPFVPTEKEADALINGCTRKISTALEALKETGFRIGELWDCKWTDLTWKKARSNAEQKNMAIQEKSEYQPDLCKGCMHYQNATNTYSLTQP